MSDESDRIRAAREAAQWLALLNSRRVATDTLNDFYEWRRDPTNAAAYARGEAIWHQARDLGDDREIAEAVRAALERPRLAEGRRVTRRLAIAGGSAAVAAVAGGSWWFANRALEYRTAIGEQLVVHLDDGSRLRLNTNSAVRVRLGTARRAVRLLHGQAIFEVARDSTRPFVVQSADFAVEALGTRFEVSAIARRPGHVLLIEGRISIDRDDGAWRHVLEHPGDSLSVEDEAAPALARENVDLATSWTTGRLIFRGTPLEQAIAEVNRYSRGQIVLAASDEAGRKVDGAFETGDTASFVAAVTALFGLRAQQSQGDRIVLS